MKKILITGASGFIGKNLVEFLEEKKYNVKKPSREELDLTDKESVESYLLKGNFDIIIHAANTNDFKYAVSSNQVLENNLRMFFNLERCSKLYKKMFYFGSGAEYSMEYYVPKMTEEYFDKHIPKDSYGFSKYIMSKIANRSDNIYDLRLFGVYGKYEEWKRRFISNNLCKSIKGMNMTINKNMMFDYLYIEDLCNIMEWFINNEPKYKQYNVCTGNVIDLYSIAMMINKCTGLNRSIEVYEKGWKKEYSGDNTLLLQEIGKFEFTDLETGIESLYKYYLKIEKNINFDI